MAEIHAALERAVQDKAKNDAAIDALGEKMKAVEALIEELVLKKRKDTLSEGEREHLEALRKEKDELRKDKDELRNDKLHIYTITLALINHLAQLEAQKGAGTVLQNVLCNLTVDTV